MSEISLETPQLDARLLVGAQPARSPRRRPGSDGPPTGVGRLLSALSFRRLSAVYIFIALFVIYSLWVPNTFLTVDTWRSLLDNQALTALAAVGLTIPVAAGAFDLAIGSEVGFASIAVSWLLVNHGMPVGLAIPLTLLFGAVIGGVSAALVSLVKIDSFIATLGVSSVALAFTQWISGGTQILNLPAGFVSFSTNRLFGITVPVSSCSASQPWSGMSWRTHLPVGESTPPAAMRRQPAWRACGPARLLRAPSLPAV